MNDDFGPSSAIWQLYLAESREEDMKHLNNMTADTNGVLVFTGLFGAIVAAFIIESYKQLQPDTGGTRVALLVQISQQIAAGPNGTQVPQPSSLNSTSFRPSSSALRVNILWFLSLALSLSCALSATLMQQWARRHISNTQVSAPVHRRGNASSMRIYSLDCRSSGSTKRSKPFLPSSTHRLFCSF